jgi:hypothetical protein
MPIDTFVTNIISNLPNFAIAVVVLYWQEKRIATLLDVQAKLIDQLLAMADDRDDAVREVRTLMGNIVHDSKVNVPKRNAPGGRYGGEI